LVRPPRVPAMLLLQGSGPVDRDGNIPGVFATDLEKQIAEALAAAGIASLRCDKRGVDANKGEMPKDPRARADFVDWDNFVDDAAAAWRFLRDQPGIDPQRVGIFGHSEGGVIALAAARRLLDAGETPAALVLASTPGRPVSEVLNQQIARLLKQKGLSPGKAEQVLETAEHIQQKVAETGQIPDNVPQALKLLYRPGLGQYWQSFMRIDPAQLAELFPGPVLVVEGTADTQVSARDDALALDAALSERAADDHDLLIVPRVGHELKPADAPQDRAEAAPIKPSLVREITAWVKEKLAEA
ncbi:MAG: alpha/beta hydrolase family protein, partial [Stellaceae bacterium]